LYTLYLIHGEGWSQEAKYAELWANTTSAWLAGADLIFQWIGMLEYIPYYGGPEPDLLDDFANTQGLAYPGSIQPQVRPGVYLEVGIPR
jgi:hypothetical protein